MFKRTAVLVVSCSALLAGCDTSVQEENEEILSNLAEAGFPAGDITIVDEAVYVGGDARVSLESSREMLQRGEGSQEQYRTTNIVDKSVVKKICINPTATFNSHAKLSQGLDLAIGNYNALGLCFTMVRGPATGCNANITAQTISGTGGNSGFPSGGKPYSSISIGTGLNASTSSLDLAEHVITHELGHALGLRHSDFYFQVNCNPGGEGLPIGAIHIPGTPTTSYVGSSIMNSCTRSTETGEFTSSDVTAFRYLYGC